MDFIQNDEPFLIGFEEQSRILELVPIRPGFEIEIKCVHAFGDFKGQRGLAGLPRPNQGSSGLTAQGLADGPIGATINDPCKLIYKLLICKDNLRLYPAHPPRPRQEGARACLAFDTGARTGSACEKLTKTDDLIQTPAYLRKQTIR